MRSTGWGNYLLYKRQRIDVVEIWRSVMNCDVNIFFHNVKISIRYNKSKLNIVILLTKRTDVWYQPICSKSCCRSNNHSLLIRALLRPCCRANDLF